MSSLLSLFSLSVVVPFSTIILFCNSVSSSQASCPDHERLSLLRFKNSFLIDCSVSATSNSNITPYAKVETWVGGETNCCSWDGVDCDKNTGHVIGLNLTASCLYGTFPPNSTIFNLAYLRNLSLDYNDFNYSQIPSEIGQLSKLRILGLFDSKFSGQVPAEVSTLSELTALELGDDSTGSPLLKLQNPSLERLVQNLTRLQELYLVNVDVSAAVPLVLQNMTTLKQIIISNCNLRGKLPTNLFHLPHLETLALSYNHDLGGSLPEFPWNSPLNYFSLLGTSLSGYLPPSIGRLSQLEVLVLTGCQISGSIPSSLGNLTKLSYLHLANNDFSGVIPASISNLTNLEALDLLNLNVMPGQLFSNFGKLHKLTLLGLSGIKLDANIPPSFANLTDLTELYLTNTQVVGTLPHWFANLTQLVALDLGKNQLSGPIPQWFTQLTNLQVVDLSQNNLFGNFETFSGLENLRTLILSGISLMFSPYLRTNSSLFQLQLLGLESCNLTKFPIFLRDQHELEHLQLAGNHIKGTIPQWFVNASKESLLNLDLSDNNLTGFEQSVTVLPWNRLEVFNIRGNNFQGELPIPPVSIQGYDVSDNLFTGVIPKQICMARSPITLDLSNNNLSSQLIPHCIGEQLGDSLQLLNLRGNNFHGGIPRSFSTNCNLKMINLGENQLQGDLPRSFANCTMLEVLDIGKNRINDTFPSWLGSLPNLQVFVASHNNFHGNISGQDLAHLGPQFRSLRIIDLSHNFYTGDLPTSYLRNWIKMMSVNEEQTDSYSTNIPFQLQSGEGQYTFGNKYEYSITITSKGSELLYSKILKVFRVIDFSSNKFTGEIPDVMSKLKGLQALNLSNNNLDGMIPASIANMKDLESLDISRNMLSGVIPPELPQLTSLEVFDVSYNNLVGRIPQGKQFDTFPSNSYVGNDRLCGSPLSKQCQNDEVSGSQPITNDLNNEDADEWIDWIIRSCGCVSGFIIGAVIGKLYITDKYHQWFIKTFQRNPRRKVKRSTRHQRRR